MQASINNSTTKLLVFITAFQILNLSIDTPGAQMTNYPATQDKFNYVDSYVEFIAEVILKYDNAVPESNHRQQKEWQQHKQVQLICNFSHPVDHPLICQPVVKIYFEYTDQYFYHFSREIKPPPKFS